MFENLLIQADLDIELDNAQRVRLQSSPSPDLNAPGLNILELKIPNVVAGVALLRQAMALSGLATGGLDQRFSQINTGLAQCNTRLDVYFLNQKLVSLGQGGSSQVLEKLLAAFPQDR
ncbi:hypothetical protein [Vampirovibrio chlorellavorus]|uniref:hypothetical protein n=1 Tax=Vampirovibrio chlorellavorus TaxID=758823 RepID=UPI0026EBE4E3|nr:hypothetical protein [Vampirovibrio chlorellavorus]